METLAEQENVASAERHYTVIKVAEMWHLSADKVREIFEHEPGVLVIGDTTRLGYDLVKNSWKRT